MEKKYTEFKRLKRSIINKLVSIQEGDRMDSYSDNMLENIRNSETFQETMEEMLETEKLVNELVEYEKTDGYEAK